MQLFIRIDNIREKPENLKYSLMAPLFAHTADSPNRLSLEYVARQMILKRMKTSFEKKYMMFCVTWNILASILISVLGKMIVERNP